MGEHGRARVRREVLIKCSEYAEYLGKSMGLTREEVERVVEACTRSGKYWRAAAAYAAANLIRYGPSASAAASRALRDLEYFRLFAPRGATPRSFASHVAGAVAMLRARNPEMVYRVDRDDLLRRCSSLGLPDSVCSEAARIFESLARAGFMTGKSRKGLAAAAVAYAAAAAGIAVERAVVARTFLISKPTLDRRLEELERFLGPLPKHN